MPGIFLAFTREPQMLREGTFFPVEDADFFITAVFDVGMAGCGRPLQFIFSGSDHQINSGPPVFASDQRRGFFPLFPTF